MSDVPRIPLVSADPLAERAARLRELFPDAVTEGRIDFERLKQALGENVATDRERYELSWAGKSEARRILQSPSMGTLAPDRAQSVNFDTTKNMIIEGDNLEVLKLLQKDYTGRVKMIYIDPPYNTGNEFIYPDNFREGLQDYLRYSGQVKGDKMQSTDTERSGQIHSKWLSMMYPRLFLAKNLLREDGIIFVSIDDNEVHNLRLLMDDIFGEENLLAELVWDLGTGTMAGHFTRAHEYVFAYTKKKSMLSNFRYNGPEDTISERAIKKISRDNPASEITFPAGVEYEGADAEMKGQIGTSEIITIVSEKMVFRDGKLVQPVTLSAGWAMKTQILSWIEGKETYDTKGQKVVRFYFDKNGRLQYEKERGFINPPTMLRNLGSTRKGSIDLVDLLGEKVMDFPKPVDLASFLIGLNTSRERDEKNIVLDFFAGSGTSAQAVLELNAEDGGNRKFILVQLPEKTDNPQYPTIAHITRERMRKYFS